MSDTFKFDISDPKSLIDIEFLFNAWAESLKSTKLDFDRLGERIRDTNITVAILAGVSISLLFVSLDFELNYMLTLAQTLLSLSFVFFMYALIKSMIMLTSIAYAIRANNGSVEFKKTIEQQTNNFSKVDDIKVIKGQLNFFKKNAIESAEEYMNIFWDERITSFLVYLGIALLYFGLVLLCFFLSIVVGITIVLSPVLIYLFSFSMKKIANKRWELNLK